MSIFVLALILIPLIFIWIKFRDKQPIASKGTCLLCDEVFAESELMEDEEKFFCHKHFEVYKASEWVATKEIRITQDNLDLATSLQDLKNDLKASGIPSYINSTYEVDGVDIITISKLYQRRIDIID